MSVRNQTFLDSSQLSNDNFPRNKSNIKIVNWNIQNPSLTRAIKQVDWLLKIQPNVIILTEAKVSKGCLHIVNKLSSSGYFTYKPSDVGSDYCVIMASRGVGSEIKNLNVGFLPQRLLCLACDTFLGVINIVGIYVPSRGPKERRNVDKRKFQRKTTDLFNEISKERRLNRYVVCGDLNVIERNHIPSYSIFGEWEYSFYESFIENGLVDIFTFLNPGLIDHSWFGRGGDGYRFDHIFVAKKLLTSIKTCSYLHEPRLLKLSDHSAMIVIIKADES